MLRILVHACASGTRIVASWIPKRLFVHEKSWWSSIECEQVHQSKCSDGMNYWFISVVLLSAAFLLLPVVIVKYYYETWINNSVLIIMGTNGDIEEHNENKYLILVHTNESKHTKKVWRTVEQNRISYKINK